MGHDLSPLHGDEGPLSVLDVDIGEESETDRSGVRQGVAAPGHWRRVYVCKHTMLPLSDHSHAALLTTLSLDFHRTYSAEKKASAPLKCESATKQKEQLSIILHQYTRNINALRVD